jgi:hypothetical protein
MEGAYKAVGILSRFPTLLNSLHLVDGEAQDVDHVLDILDFV